MAQERTETVQVRLTPEEKEAFTRAAASEGISLSDWLRRIGRAAAAKALGIHWRPKKR